MLLWEYDKPVIFAYDEIQNEFNSRNYRNFPYELSYWDFSLKDNTIYAQNLYFTHRFIIPLSFSLIQLSRIVVLKIYHKQS